MISGSNVFGSEPDLDLTKPKSGISAAEEERGKPSYGETSVSLLSVPVAGSIASVQCQSHRSDGQRQRPRLGISIPSTTTASPVGGMGDDLESKPSTSGGSVRASASHDALHDGTLHCRDRMKPFALQSDDCSGSVMTSTVVSARGGAGGGRSWDDSESVASATSSSSSAIGPRELSSAGPGQGPGPGVGGRFEFGAE